MEGCLPDGFEDLGGGVKKRVLQAAPAGAPAARGRVTCRYEARAGSASAPVVDAATTALTLPEEDVPGAEVVLPVLPGVARGLRSMRVGETADLLLEPAGGGGGGGGSGGGSGGGGGGGGFGSSSADDDNDDDAAAAAPLFVRVTLLAAAEPDFSPDLDFGAMARNFREEGNRLLSESRDAAGAAAAYEQALFCVAKAEREPAGSAAGGDAPAALAKLRVVLHSNRAQALLKLSRWDEAAAECSAALLVDGAHSKSLFRRARALIGAGRLEAARVDARALAALQGPPGREARTLMAELGLADELPPAEAAAAAAHLAGEGGGAEVGASSAAAAPRPADAAGPAGDEKKASLLRRRGGKGPGALELAAKRGFGDLYADMSDVEELRRCDAERAARRAAARGGAGADAEGRGCFARWWMRACTFCGCEQPGRRKRRGGSGWC